MLEITQCRALRKGHWYFTRDYHTEHLVDTSYIFTWPKNTNKYGRELYNEFSDLLITAVVTPNPEGGRLLAQDVASRFGADVKSMAVRRERGILITTDLRLTERDNVLVVDDGINTGNSLTQLLTVLDEKFHCECPGVGIFIDRYIRDFEKDFGKGRRLVTLFSLKEGYPIVKEEECKRFGACRRFDEIDNELKSLGSDDASERKFELQREKANLLLRPAYGGWG